MIGIINNDLIFEFKEENELSFALQVYCNTNNINTLYIASRSDSIKSILHEGKFLFMPHINENEEYILYGCYCSSAPKEIKNDYVPSTIDYTTASRFKIKHITIPTSVSKGE